MKHAYKRQREKSTQADDFRVIGLNEFAAKLRMLTGGKRSAGTDTSARRVTRIDHGDYGTGTAKFVRCRQAGKAGSGDNDTSTMHLRHRSNCSATHL